MLGDNPISAEDVAREFLATQVFEWLKNSGISFVFTWELEELNKKIEVLKESIDCLSEPIGEEFVSFVD